MRNLIIVLVMVVGVLNAKAGEEYNFTWNYGKKDVGRLKVSTVETDDGTTINYSSTYTVKVAVELKNIDSWQVTYSDGVMSTMEVKNELNGRTRVDISEGASDGGFTRVVNGKAKLVDHGPVDFSYIKLFVKEPQGVLELYSELYGEHFAVRESGKHSYTVTDSRNRRHKFNYDEDGKLVKAEIIMSMGTFTLLPK